VKVVKRQVCLEAAAERIHELLRTLRPLHLAVQHGALTRSRGSQERTPVRGVRRQPVDLELGGEWLPISQRQRRQERALLSREVLGPCRVFALGECHGERHRGPADGALVLRAGRDGLRQQRGGRSGAQPVLHYGAHHLVQLTRAPREARRVERCREDPVEQGGLIGCARGPARGHDASQGCTRADCYRSVRRRHEGLFPRVARQEAGREDQRSQDVFVALLLRAFLHLGERTLGLGHVRQHVRC
jgi:hypothetical protein